MVTDTKPDDPALTKSLDWLRNNLRESGRWFTQSVNADHAHYITNAGTGYALMALKVADGFRP
jgi:squalene-hopene/tetraprenyl-beta-curcumene cyclase